MQRPLIESCRMYFSDDSFGVCPRSAHQKLLADEVKTQSLLRRTRYNFKVLTKILTEKKPIIT